MFDYEDKTCLRCGDTFRIYTPQQRQKKYCNNAVCADKVRWIAYKKKLQETTA